MTKTTYLTDKHKRGTVAKQSLHDGLCGFYCLVNAIRGWDRLNDAADPDAFRYLLEAADRLGLFKVEKIAKGYESHELVDIFNEFARAHRFPAKALHLQAAAEAFEGWTFAVQAKRIFDVGGQIVVSVDDGDHWVLAYDFKYDGDKKVNNLRILVEDANPSDRAVLDIGKGKIGEAGLILLPNSAPLKFAD